MDLWNPSRFMRKMEFEDRLGNSAGVCGQESLKSMNKTER